jgi:hypothetical protein
MPSPTIASDSSSINSSDDAEHQHDDSVRQNASFTLEDLSKFPRELSRRIDWITRCNNPIEFLRILGLHPKRRKSKQAVLDDDDYMRVMDFGDTDEEIINPYVAFQMPQHCEYCGAPSTNECDPRACPRPSTFFPKQQPPFAKPNAKIYNDNKDDIAKRRILQGRRRKRPPIRSNDHWKIVATPKTKNQWISPTSANETSSPVTTNPRLLFPNVDCGSSNSSSNRSVTSSSGSGHPSFFPVSTRELLKQRPQRFE